MSALIGVDELFARLGEVVLVDVRWSLTGPPGREEYLRGHLPGAHFVDLDAELAGPPGPRGRHPMPSVASLQAVLHRCGIDDDSTVVVLDARTSQASARAWWLLRWAGCADVRVLDGGVAAWEAAGLPLTTQVPVPGEGTATARPGRLPVLDAAGAAAAAASGVLLDSRSAERYAGAAEPVDPVAGHVPGAVNAPMTDYLREDGTFLPAAELAAYFADRGVRPGAAVATMCGSGVTAMHTVLALDAAGIDRLVPAVYVGSWSEWVADPSRPVATGPTP